MENDELKELREIYGLEVMVKSWIEGSKLCYLYSVNKLGKSSAYRNHFPTYEEALKEGILEARKLIK